MKKILPLLLIGGAVALYFVQKNKNSGANLSDAEKLAYLRTIEPNWPNFTSAELADVYTFMKMYQAAGGEGGSVNLPADLRARINAISAKYNIFT